MTDSTVSTDPRAALRAAFGQAAHLVEHVSPAELLRPTPCTEFDVAALLGHMVGAVRRVASVGRGEEQAELSVPTGVADDGWAAVFNDAKDDALAVWTDDGLLDQTIVLPFGVFPGAVVAGIYTLELVTHGWDLATATGQQAALDPELAVVALVIAEQALPAEPRGGEIPFDAVVPTAPGAAPYDLLAAYLGRRPS